MENELYDIKAVTKSPTDIKKISELLQAAFPKVTYFTPEFLDWLYFQNPHGDPVGYNAFSGSSLIAHHIAIPFQARIRGEACPGLLALNTATHPKHQGKGLFVKLATATYLRAKELGHEFVIGVSNSNSTHGMVTKLGFQLVCPLVAKVGVGRIRRRSRCPHLEYEREWSENTLAWRLKNPWSDYYWAEYPSSYQILAKTDKFGFFAILYNCSHSMEPNSSINRWRKIKSPLRLWLGIDPQIDWKNSLYIELPNIFKPSPLNLVFKDLTEKGRRLEEKSTRFQALDFDAF